MFSFFYKYVKLKEKQWFLSCYKEYKAGLFELKFIPSFIEIKEKREKHTIACFSLL
ncbi:hypothetical protein RV15_GL001256 [Enterococcus silesiacus]|uniref:Uncharacterized protein n=1 Tax=Enterococcus silesiacus TaxID=332949 RepID=A0AA91JQS0_9ENTE|nr:hypothetical protein RV15_GL001256 [Enterococcus silesiacus]